MHCWNFTLMKKSGFYLLIILYYNNKKQIDFFEKKNFDGWLIEVNIPKFFTK